MRFIKKKLSSFFQVSAGIGIPVQMGSDTFMEDTRGHVQQHLCFVLRWVHALKPRVGSPSCLWPGGVPESGTVADIGVIFAVRALQLDTERIR